MEEGQELVRRLLRSGARRVALANLVGGALVLGYFELTSVPAKGVARGHWSDYVLAGVYWVAIWPLAARFIGRRALRLLAFVAEDRAATPAERDGVLRQPVRLAQVTLASWLFVAATSAALNYVSHNSPGQAGRVFFGLAFAGFAVAFLTALLIERNSRPVVARALAGRPPERTRVLGVRRRLLLFWALGSGTPLLGIALSPLGLPSTDQGRVIVACVLLAVIGLVSGLVFTAVAASSVAEPITDVRAAMGRIAAGDLGADVPVDDDGEIGLLQAGFNHMAAGLRERERMRELFGGYVGEHVAQRAVEEGVSLEGEQREVSALFVDVIGSTALAERIPALEVVRLLNQFFEVVIAEVDGEDGWVNKFEGDAALCVFGAPVAQADHAARALRAATAMRDALSQLPGLDAGIGVSCGLVVAGNVGSDRRYEYTVVGDPVNEAARLTELAKSHPARVVASERIVRAAGQDSCWQRAECVTLRGRREPTQTFVPS